MPTPHRLTSGWLQAMEEEYRQVTEQEKAEVVQLGGLHVIGTERHESRRIDNQLRGRCGRCGSPPSSGWPALSAPTCVGPIHEGPAAGSLDHW